MSRVLLKTSELIGMPVVTITGGEDVAETRDVVYDPSAGRIVGLTLNKRGFFSGRMRDVLPGEAIASIGRDAVMIRDQGALVAPAQAPAEVSTPARERNVMGNDVLTEKGVRLGKVSDLVALVGSAGEVVGYELTKEDGGVGYIPLPAQLAVSGVALIVPDATQEFMRDDLTGLGAAVDEFRARLGLES